MKLSVRDQINGKILDVKKGATTSDVRLGALLAAGLALLPSSAALAAGKVNVLYAGSLVNLMEHGVGPAFDKTGDGVFQGFAQGSKGLANQIKGRLRRGDVFISATANVNNG